MTRMPPCPLWLLSCILGLGVLFAAYGQDSLPADADGLLEYAQKHRNHKHWRQADRAFKRFLEKFPKDRRQEEVLAQLARIQYRFARHYAAARGWYERLVKEFPQSKHHLQYRIAIARCYAAQNLRLRAIEEYEAIIKEAKDKKAKASLIRQVWGLKNKHLNFYVNQTFGAGKNPKVRVYSRQVPDAEMRLYRIPYAEILERLGPEAPSLGQAIAKVPDKARKLVKKWTEKFPATKKRWHNSQLEIPASESGVYLLEADHDRLTMRLHVLINRYGLITKAAAGDLLLFAQNRKTGEPVKGMRIRAHAEKKTFEGVTDADGIFTASDFPLRTPLVGVFDDEVVSVQPGARHWWGSYEKASLFYVSTDRPIYRPNHKVHFKIVHRIEEGSAFSLQAGLKVKVTIHDPKGNKIYEKEHALGRYGSTNGDLVLGDEPALGQYRIQIQPVEKTAPAIPNYWFVGMHQVGVFRVDEYRKPEFKVTVSFNKKHYVQGDAIDADVAADYYFGSPVADADVGYQVFRRAHYISWYRWPYWYSWYAQDEEMYAGWHRGALVSKGTGKTDKHGRFKVRFDSKEWDRDAYYTIVADVTDLSRRKVSNVSGAIATQAEFALNVQLDKYVYRPRDTVKVEVRTVRADGTPEPGQVVTVMAFPSKPDPRKRMPPLFSQQVKTDEQGLGAVKFKAAKAGRIYVRASTADARDRKVQRDRHVWVCDQSWDGGYMSWNGIDVIPDRKAYEPGETATFLITSQEKGMTFLFTMEGKEVYHHRVVKMNGHTAVLDVKLDNAALAPNFFVSVIALSGDKLFQKTKSVVVNPSKRFLKVTLEPDRRQYRPRDPATVRITTTGADGKPVSAEVSLAIVDEAIFALQTEYTPDIRRFFHRPRFAQVATSSSLQHWGWGEAGLREDKEDEEGHGALGAVAKAPASEMRNSRGRGGKKGKSRLAQTEVRSLFADTMLWLPSVTTDDKGVAVVKIPQLADNLTTWRLTARAATADGRFGQAVSETIVRKDVLVRVHMPRFLTQGDETIVSAVVHNDLERENTIRVQLQADGLHVDGELDMEIVVEAHGQHRVDWKALVKQPGTATVTVKALSEIDSDAMRVSLPVLPHGSLQWHNRAGLLETTVTERVTLPEQSIQAASELFINISPTHASVVLDALDYLAGYPYGCVEQTMSRFLPSAVTLQALGRLGIRKPDLEKELPHMVQAGLQRLYNFQHGDGGWGWWKNDKSNPMITAYVMYGFAQARAADVQIDQNVMNRGLVALRKHLKGASEPAERAYILFALSQAGQRDDAARDTLYRNFKTLPADAKAMLALVLHQDGKKAAARGVLDALLGDAQTHGGKTYWEGGKKVRWTGHRIDATALGLKALMAVDPENKIRSRVVTWLATNRQDRYWVSTRQTAMVVHAMVDYLKFTKDLEMDMTISLSLNGEKVFNKRVTKDNWQTFDGTLKFDASKLKTGANEIVLEKNGQGTPVYSIYLRYFKEAETFEASKGDLRIKRTYHRIGFDGTTKTYLPLKPGAKLQSGDEVRVTIEVDAARPFRYLMIEDPMPAGFEAVRDTQRHRGRWSWWYSNKEFRDEKTAIAVTWLPAGKRTVTYVMRAETPGKVRVLPTLAWNMYQPEEGANSAGASFTVVD